MRKELKSTTSEEYLKEPGPLSQEERRLPCNTGWIVKGRFDLLRVVPPRTVGSLKRLTDFCQREVRTL